MALWNYQSNLVLLSSRFLNVERKKDCIIVKYYCETNMALPCTRHSATITAVM